MSLGTHVINWAGSPILDLILETGISPVKLMNNPDPDPIERILAKWPKTAIICRKYFDDWEQTQLLESGISGGQRCANMVADHFARVSEVCRKYNAPIYMEGVNEPPLRPYNEAPKRLAIYTDGFARSATPRLYPCNAQPIGRATRRHALRACLHLAAVGSGACFDTRV